MGYCYQGNQLCCDVCGQPGGVRKRACPHGYCPKLAVCPSCWKNGTRAKFLAPEAHALCEVRNREWREIETKRVAMLAEGKTVRTSAVRTSETNVVGVLFRDKDGRESMFYMLTSTYEALPLIAPASPEDYATHGKVLPCPHDFYAIHRRDPSVVVPPLSAFAA